jgi:hypothetical protein
MRLAVAEAPIDAMPLAALEGPRANTLYLATGGGIGPCTEMALVAALRCVSHAVLLAATDADAGGRPTRAAATPWSAPRLGRPGGRARRGRRQPRRTAGDSPRAERAAGRA